MTPSRASPPIPSSATSRIPPRAILCAILFLTIGVIVNLAVAWGLYLWRPFEGYPFRPELTTARAQRVWDRCWPPGSPFTDDPDARKYNVCNESTSSPAYRIIVVWHNTAGQRLQFNNPGWAWEIQAGWPARSLVGHRWADRTNHGLLDTKGSLLHINSRGGPIFDQLPFRPFWPGFAINTILYGGLLWFLFALPGLVRDSLRRLRRWAGRCERCAYDLRGAGPGKSHDRCPECGHPT